MSRGHWFAALLAVVGMQDAYAEMYQVTGAKTGFGFNPPPPVTPKITDTPASPAFTGSWKVDPNAVSGTIAFAPYQVRISALLFKADLNFEQAAYSIDGGTVAYDPATLTLKLSDGRLRYTGKAPQCNGSSTICDAQPTADMERFDLTLTFADPTLNTFQGKATAVNHGGSNGNSVYTWTFSGRAAMASDSNVTESDMALRGAGPQ